MGNLDENDRSLWALLTTFLKDEMLETAITGARPSPRPPPQEQGAELEAGRHLRKGWSDCGGALAGGASDLLSDRSGERSPKKQT